MVICVAKDAASYLKLVNSFCRDLSGNFPGFGGGLKNTEAINPLSEIYVGEAAEIKNACTAKSGKWLATKVDWLLKNSHIKKYGRVRT